MGERIRGHIRSNVVGYVALFVALSGTAYAVDGPLPGQDQVGSADIINNEVQTADIRDANLTTADIRAGAVITGKLADGAVSTAKLADGAVTEPKLGCKGNDSADVMVEVGSVCVDRYEASVWSEPDGGVQYGVSSDDYPCGDNGQDCEGEIYARSVAGVTPSHTITWFQAQAALANSGKRLPTNAEWQMAVAGTPDPGGSPGAEDCNTDSTSELPAATGSFNNCVSDYGVNDMVGNVNEWVADWVPDSTNCPGWGTFSDDSMCLSGAATATEAPGAMFRGGSFLFGTSAGPFMIDATRPPQHSDEEEGFRGAR